MQKTDLTVTWCQHESALSESAVQSLDMKECLLVVLFLKATTCIRISIFSSIHLWLCLHEHTTPVSITNALIDLMQLTRNIILVLLTESKNFILILNELPYLEFKVSQQDFAVSNSDLSLIEQKSK